MNKVLLSLSLTVLSLSGAAQIFPSSCAAPDSVKQAYRTDAQRLALRRVFQLKTSEMDSTNIPADKTDTALNALILLYNAGTMPARDTVIDMLNIHSFATSLDSPYKFSMNKLEIYADQTYPWMDDYKNGIIPTSDASINQFQNFYNLHFDTYVDLTFGFDGLEFTSDSNYNMHAVAANFSQAFPNSVGNDMGMAGDGPDIMLDTVTATYTQLTFRYGWEDCPVGCIYNRYWTFQCNFDCTVTYIGSTGDTLPWQPNSVANIGGGAALSVYPNPFNDKIIVKNVAEGSDYLLYSVTGATIQQGKLSEGAAIAPDCPPGFYFLRVSDKEKTRTVKLLKE
jgi:hypothetical protein